jgi:predicted Zn finger-like uncharacterized protein
MARSAEVGVRSRPTIAVAHGESALAITRTPQARRRLVRKPKRRGGSSAQFAEEVGVIVDCQSCHTRFRLDESRIPATGAKVRCSRCKTAFIVQRPSAKREEVIDEVVAEATNPGAARAPAPTEDLFETTGSRTMSLGEPGGGGGSETSSDEKWEFDEAPREASPPLATTASARSAPNPARATHETDDLDSLGSPEGWDLLGGAREIAAEARFEAPAPPQPGIPATPRATARQASEPARTFTVDSSLAAAAAAEAPRAEHVAAPAWLQGARRVAQYCIDSGVWIASVGLCGVGLLLALSPPAESPSTGGSPGALSASLRDEKLDLTRRTIESGVGGSLTVVRGQLPPSAVTARPLRLRASWLDAEGRAIRGLSAIAGPPLSQRKLRELSLERLREEHEAHALELTAGGAFEAVFGVLPSGAHGIALRQEPLPVEPPAVTQAQEAVAEAVTASSRPTARPSSE